MTERRPWWRWRRRHARSVRDALLVGVGRCLRWFGLFVLLYVTYWMEHPWLFKGFWRLDVIYGGGGYHE